MGGQDLTLGIIGLSPGNGHPYSWSAIINGYDEASMSECPFPVIPEYLGRQVWPSDQISGAIVTHVHAPEAGQACAVAKACAIPHVTELQELCEAVDAVLLARDDADNHYRLARPALELGRPIYIDKPIALSRYELERLFDLQTFDGQIFTCSALSYSPEFRGLRDVPLEHITHIGSRAPKDWVRYGMHAIEPVVAAIWPRVCGQRWQSNRFTSGATSGITVRYEDGLEATYACTGDAEAGFRIIVNSDEGRLNLSHQDSFSAFKAALGSFIAGAREGKSATDYSMVGHCVDLLEAGN